MKTTVSINVLLLSCLLLSCKLPSNKNINRTENNSPQNIGYKIITDLLSRKEMMMYRTSELQTIHYAEVCTAMGALRLLNDLKDTITIKQVINRYQGILNNYDSLPTNHVDANVWGILPLEIYMQKGKREFLKQGLYFADKQWDNPLKNGLSNQTRFWIDDMYMIGMLQVQAYKASKNRIYIERAAIEIDAYLKKLQQPNGLFYHGSSAPFFWGRGNGWVAVGLIEVLTVLPSTNEHYNSILKGYKKMIDCLIQYQSESGMWRQLIDKPEAWEESSATAMFGYSIKKGLDIKLLQGKEYESASTKAWNALVKHIDKDGKLDNICVGTGQSNDMNYYLQRPKTTGDLHGQAPMLWFACSLLEK